MLVFSNQGEQKFNPPMLRICISQVHYEVEGIKLYMGIAFRKGRSYIRCAMQLNQQKINIWWWPSVDSTAGFVR